MKRISILFVLFVAAPAYAEHDYGYQLSRCVPSCYTPKPPDDSEKARQICGYQDYSFSQLSLGGGKWTALESGGVPINEPTELKVCKIPKAAGGKWAPLLAQARKEFPGMEAGDVLTVEKGDDFTSEKVMLENSKGKLVQGVRRSISMRLYSKTYDLRPGECGSTNPNILCEFSSKGRGPALGFNEARYRLDEAAKLKAAGDLKGCQIATWSVVGIQRAIEKLRVVRKKENEWAPGRKWKTRTAGILDEKTLFTKLEGMAVEATALFKECKGVEADLADAYDNAVGP